jgi:hypothetical protein
MLHLDEVYGWGGGLWGNAHADSPQDQNNGVAARIQGLAIARSVLDTYSTGNSNLYFRSEWTRLVKIRMKG